MTAARGTATSVPSTAASSIAAAQTPRQAARRARRIRSDLRFLRIYVHTIARVARYRPHADALAASEAPLDVADRIEDGLAGEAGRYRALGWCILGLLGSLPLIALFLWSAMYWLPIRVYWWPFERGNYGLPFFSLFEWVCYLVLAAYFAVTTALLYTSHDQTGRLGTEYRRLLDASEPQAAAFAAAISDGAHPRAAYVLANSRVFSAYLALLGERGAS